MVIGLVGSQALFSFSFCSTAKGGLLSNAVSGPGFAAEVGVGLPEARRLADCSTASECSRAFMRRAATLAVRLLWQPYVGRKERPMWSGTQQEHSGLPGGGNTKYHLPPESSMQLKETGVSMCVHTHTKKTPEGSAGPPTSSSKEG